MRYQFGEFTVDKGTRQLTRNGDPVALTPKEFLTLLLLVEARGQAVEREFMMRSIWPDTVVGDTSLGRNISVLRRHLGSEAILSVPKFGYRLVPEVRILADSPESQTSTPRPDEVRQTEQSETEPRPSPPAPALSAGVPSRIWAWRVIASTAALIVALVLIATIGRNRVFGSSVAPEARSAAAQWDAEGTFSLREGTYFKASKAFRQAVLLDPHLAIAHAHLAEALLQLNKDDGALSELLMADNRADVRDLQPLDKLYIEAVRATAVRDYPAATREYQAILAAQPESAKSYALEDLGRAYQREGKIPEAIESYKSAAQLQPDNAGVQLHLGILMGLQRNESAANAFLDRATALYDASTNLEGVAEVSYQRGCMAYVRAQYGKAELFYNESLEVANKLSDPQLQARALGALSTVERWDGKYDQSLEHANRELQVSRDAGSDFDYAEGVMLLANLSLAKKDLEQSDALLKQALDLAQKVKNPRLVANAEFSIADLADDTGDYDREIAYAQRAQQHYQSYGSVDGAADAAMLIVQGEAGKGDLRQALNDAQALLASSERTHSDLFVEDSEAEIGDIYSAMEDEPDALTHYLRALDISRKTGSQEALKSLHVAGCLARMGRLNEAAKIFNAIPASARSDPDTAGKYVEVRIAIELGEGRDGTAIGLARKAHTQALPSQSAVELAQFMAMAETRLGQNVRAGQDADDLLTLARKAHNPYWTARAELADALVTLCNHSPIRARQMAEAAEDYFNGKSMKESEWLALLYDARALEALGDATGSGAKAQQSREVLGQLQKQWPAEDFKAYVARPDVRKSIQILDAIARPHMKLWAASVQRH